MVKKNIFLGIIFLFSMASYSESIKKNNQKFSLMVNSYRYEEPHLMELNGGGLGLDYIYKHYINAFYLDSYFSYHSSSNKYTSKNTGSMENDPTWYVDLKLLLGYEISDKSSNISLSPYTGIGFRYLDNDTSNILSSTGASGYLRINKLYYVPLGIISTYKWGNNRKLEIQIEYDHLLYGKQLSDLKGISHYTRDAIHHQYNGYGINGHVLYTIKKTSVGPFFKYWNIDGSTKDFNSSNPYVYTIEPANNTVEVGIKVSFIF